MVLATLVLAGQPIYANDTWIHLALGEAFAREGPWLAADPHLFAAPGPPSPASWLGSASLYAAYALSGFTGLRILHALSVLAILVLVARVLRRAGADRAATSLGLVLFVLLSTYRLVQLRPDLFTMAATLALHPLLFAERIDQGRGPGAGRIAAAALLVAVWSNVHAAFVLAPILGLGAGAGLLALATIRGTNEERLRARRLLLAGGACTVAGLANPLGPNAYAAYSTAGTETLALASVMDEWNPTNLLGLPVPGLPPTWAAWLACWLCVAATAAGALRGLIERFASRAPKRAPVDPVLVALAIAGTTAAVVASRFLWLGVFALALAASLGSAQPPVATTASTARPIRRCARSALLTLFCGAASWAHLSVGDWPLVSRAMRAETADYAAPYPAERYSTHAVWFLADTGVEGRIFNDYPLGGFMSFWLTPALRMSSSGTMNVERAAMEANLAVAARQTIAPGERYAALLDRQGFDLFLGLGFPVEATPGRPIPCTVRHLEREPGWLPVYRNLRSAVYLRRSPRNDANLARIAAHYAAAGVPFDPERGFEPERVIEQAPEWAIAQGMLPVDFAGLRDRVEGARKAGRVDADVHRLATLLALLGLYERALELDRFALRVDPSDGAAAWRAIWNLTQLGRPEEARVLASRFEALTAGPQGRAQAAWSGLLERIVRADPAQRATLAAHLPLLRLDQLPDVRRGIATSPVRWRRPPHG